MTYVSANKEINDFCNNLLATNLWIIDHRSKHIVLRHIAIGANKIIPIPCTPSDINAFKNLKYRYKRYLREYFKQIGLIINKQMNIQ